MYSITWRSIRNESTSTSAIHDDRGFASDMDCVGNESNDFDRYSLEDFLMPHIPTWVLTRNPSDYPGKLVVRMHLVGSPNPGPEYRATWSFTWVHKRPSIVCPDTLEQEAAIRELFRSKMYCHRYPHDDPVIAGYWI